MSTTQPVDKLIYDDDLGVLCTYMNTNSPRCGDCSLEQFKKEYLSPHSSTLTTSLVCGVSTRRVKNFASENEIRKSDIINKEHKPKGGEDMDSTKAEDKLVKELRKRKLSEKELGIVLKGLKGVNTKKFTPVKINFPDNHIRFGVFADAHIGHKDYRPDVLRKMIADGKRFGVEFWLNAGDTIEGMSGREGHIYELDYIGYSAQINFFAEEFKNFDCPVYSIEAQNSHSGWYKNKGNMGLNIGEEMEKRAKHYKFIGYDEQDIQFANGLKIRLRHPGGGTAYALSYKLQKYVESITGGDKPNILFHGHFHKSLYLFYRNVHCFESGTLADQTPFMKKIGTPAMVGYWLIDVTMYTGKQSGVERIMSTFVPFY